MDDQVSAELEAASRKAPRAPLGTMVVVLVYGAITVAMWGYLYYIMLRSGGVLGGFA